MRDLNCFLDDFALTTRKGGCVFFGLHRIFSLPLDHPVDRLQGYRWARHGRVYGRGVDCYQSMKGRDRRKLLINGETVAELDIRASWPTLIYGLLRHDLDDFDPDRWVPTANDPYGMVVDPDHGPDDPSRGRQGRLIGSADEQGRPAAAMAGGDDRRLAQELPQPDRRLSGTSDRIGDAVMASASALGAVEGQRMRRRTSPDAPGKHDDPGSYAPSQGTRRARLPDPRCAAGA